MCPNIWGIAGFICGRGGEAYQHGWDRQRPEPAAGQLCELQQPRPVSPHSFLRGYRKARYKTFLTYHKATSTKPSVASPSWKHYRQGPGHRPSYGASQRGSPRHRSPLWPSATSTGHHRHLRLRGTRDNAATKHTGLFMAHGSSELPPSPVPGEQAAEKSLFPCILNKGVQHHLALPGIRQAEGACEGPQGREGAAAASADRKSVV